MGGEFHFPILDALALFLLIPSCGMFKFFLIFSCHYHAAVSILGYLTFNSGGQIPAVALLGQCYSHLCPLRCWVGPGCCPVTPSHPSEVRAGRQQALGVAWFLIPFFFFQSLVFLSSCVTAAMLQLIIFMGQSLLGETQIPV